MEDCVWFCYKSWCLSLMECIMKQITVIYSLLTLTLPIFTHTPGHLLTSLTQHIKRSDAQGLESLDILSQLTGLTVKQASSTSVVLHHGSVPLLLRDPVSVFIQLYLNMPPHLASGKHTYTLYIHLITYVLETCNSLKVLFNST